MKYSMGDHRVYEQLLKEVYEGIDRAHPNLTIEERDEYARIAIYMIQKNKTEMEIHAPKKSRARWEKTLAELRKKSEEIKENENSQDNIVQIEDLRRKHK